MISPNQPYILVIDNDNEARAKITDQLAEENFMVYAAGTPEAAKKIIANTRKSARTCSAILLGSNFGQHQRLTGPAVLKRIRTWKGFDKTIVFGATLLENEDGIWKHVANTDPMLLVTRKQFILNGDGNEHAYWKLRDLIDSKLL